MRCCPIVEFGKPLVEMDLPTPEPTGEVVAMGDTATGVNVGDSAGRVVLAA